MSPHFSRVQSRRPWSATLLVLLCFCIVGSDFSLFSRTFKVASVAIAQFLPSRRSSFSEPFDPLVNAFSTTLGLIKVAEVDLNNEIDPFFLALIPQNDVLLAVYRTSWEWRSRVGYLDENFHLQSVAFEISEMEDARIIWYNDSVWLIDNHFEKPRKVVSFDGTARFTLNESNLGPDFQRGKNWSPFVYLDELYFVYSLDPVKVLKCTWPGARLEWVYFDGSAPNETSLYLRSGTNGLVFGEHIYGVGRYSYNTHKRMCAGQEVLGFKEHFPFLWSLPLEGLFKHNRLSTDKVRQLKVRQIKHPFTRGVNDPASLFVWKHELHVTISSCTCECMPGMQELNEHVKNEVYKVQALE